LQRYGRVFRCAEINSSFSRPHAATTYARWAAATPDDFRFAVKVPREITHERRLRRSREPLQQFLEQTAGLGAKRGPLLVQLPPSFEYVRRVADRFFTMLRSMHDGPIVCEPRHPSWFDKADALLAGHHVARAAADPCVVASASRPAGWPGLVYYRLHGSPRTYWSSYERRAIDGIAATLREHSAERWCIFDNTAAGAALENAWLLQQRLGAD
jgi:uncharacterized protein YecE (DUF72 family)